MKRILEQSKDECGIGTGNSMPLDYALLSIYQLRFANKTIDRKVDDIIILNNNECMQHLLHYVRMEYFGLDI